MGETVKKASLIIISMLIIVCTTLLAVERGIAAQGGNRVALVIGNSDYKSTPLSNPVNDATDMAAVLSKLGFEIIVKTNANRMEMLNGLDLFNQKLKRSGTGLFFYAGHGMQIGGSNYLIPVGAHIMRERDVEYEAVNAARVLAAMEDSGSSVNIVILDACRDNPFKSSFRSGSRGLSVMQASRGSFISYATSPGSVAADGEGRNGIYTKNILRHITNPELAVEEVFRNVRKDVYESTGGAQLPWDSSSLMGKFYLASSGVAIDAPSAGEDKRVSVRLTEEASAGFSSGNTYTNSLGMTFVYIEPGSFMMGSPSSESGRDKDETLHRVTLTRGYWMQTTEVTQAQWKAVMGSNPSNFKGDSLPVEKVSWDDIQDFIRKLNQRMDKITYSLPTEAQWEYAARAGSSSRFCFGDSDSQLGSYAWYDGNSGSKTHPVGQKSPNAWGLYDMHGNVWEWSQDWYGDYPSGSVSDPTGPSSGTLRVLRGGSWFNFARICRSAGRMRLTPDYRYLIIGFRLVASPGR